MYFLLMTKIECKRIFMKTFNIFLFFSTVSHNLRKIIRETRQLKNVCQDFYYKYLLSMVFNRKTTFNFFLKQCIH